MLKLFGHDTSPYVRRIRVLLRELGLPFTRDPAGWTQPSDEFRRLNPLMRVPALLDDEPPQGGGPQLLLDSRLIATYLYERCAGGGGGAVSERPAMPLQATLFRPASRYQDANLLLAIDAAVDSLINVFLLELDGVPKTSSPYLQRQEERAGRCLGFVADSLGGRTTLQEGMLSFIDIALVCALDWIQFRQRYPLEQHPALLRFLEAHAGRPALAETHPRLAASTAPPQTPAR